MDTSNTKTALQDLIIRLQDAEKGYLEISKAVANPTLQTWLKKYANERHKMHKVLEDILAKSGSDAEVKTSFLGELHRVFIDIKINGTSLENEFDAVVSEIERGASVIILDYVKVIKEVPMLPKFLQTLRAQKITIESELNSLLALKEEFNTVHA